MEEFRAFLRVLTVASLGLAVLQVYLVLNKLWIRKHERAVAESISIYGELVGLIPLSFLTLSFIMDRQWEGMVDGLLWITAGTVTIVIGSGLWVEGRQRRSFWALLKDAMALERTEVGDLARSFFQPSAADRILNLLAQVALVDQTLDPAEKEFVEGFAEAWGIDFSWEKLARDREDDQVDVMQLRSAVAEYLATSPPPSQVAQVGDVINLLVQADDEVTDLEDLMLGEVGGMLAAYVSEESDEPRFAVALVPQSEEQERAIRSVLPRLEKESIAGGSAFVVGRYFSDRYAEIVREHYRALPVFTTVLRVKSPGG